MGPQDVFAAAPWLVAGAAAGHLARRAVPRLLRLRDRSLPFSWPWMEVVTAVAFVVLALRGAPWPPFALTLLLVTVCATDYRVKLIPDVLTLGGAALGLVAAALEPARLLGSPFHTLLLGAWGLGSGGPHGSGSGMQMAPWLAGALIAALGAAFGFALLEAIRRGFGLVVRMPVMGMGDSKLLMLIGAFLGPAGVALAVMPAFLLGVVHGLVMLRITRLPHSPFGPPLAAAGWLTAAEPQLLLLAIAGFQGWILRLPLPLLGALYVALLGLVAWILLRTRRRSESYAQTIEDDYRRLENQLED